MIYIHCHPQLPNLTFSHAAKCTEDNIYQTVHCSNTKLPYLSQPVQVYWAFLLNSVGCLGDRQTHHYNLSQCQQKDHSSLYRLQLKISSHNNTKKNNKNIYVNKQQLHGINKHTYLYLYVL